MKTALLIIIITALMAGCSTAPKLQAACDCYGLLPPNCYFEQINGEWALFCP